MGAPAAGTTRGFTYFRAKGPAGGAADGNETDLRGTTTKNARHGVNECGGEMMRAIFGYLRGGWIFGYLNCPVRRCIPAPPRSPPRRRPSGGDEMRGIFGIFIVQQSSQPASRSPPSVSRRRRVVRQPNTTPNNRCAAQLCIIVTNESQHIVDVCLCEK